MAFIDDISSKITRTGQSAINKTKTMAEVARLNSQISEQERKINNGYFQIGKLYYSLHGENYEPDFAILMEAVREAERAIADCKRQIQVVKGVKLCENCGAENPSAGVFCSTCGSPLPQPVIPMDPNMVLCPTCGKPVARGMRFCTNCGSPMPEEVPVAPAPTPAAAPAEAPAAPAAEGAAAAPEAPAQGGVAFCTSCGAPLEADTAFCTECGAKVN